MLFTNKIKYMLWWALLLFSGCKLIGGEESINDQSIVNIMVTIPIDSLLCLSPKHEVCFNFNKEPMDFQYIIYYDSTICSPCELGKMGIWRSIIKNTNKLGVNIDFMFVFCPPKTKIDYITSTYRKQNSLFRIYVDSIQIVERYNPFLSKLEVPHAFLLDKEKRIVFEGNPANNEAIERQFYNFLKNYKANSCTQ